MSDRIPENLKSAINKYLAGEATLEETELVTSWYHSFDDSNIEIDSDIPDLEERVGKRLKLRLDHSLHIRSSDSPSFLSMNSILFKAAAIIIILSIGLYFVAIKDKSSPILERAELTYKESDVLPGGNKAFLILENGSQVALDRIRIGETIHQGDVNITKTSDGQVVYKSTATSLKSGASIAYNTITIPRGGKYRVDLPDGSRVWLNSSSSLTYPTVFSGKVRKVKLEGEAYFEIAHNHFLPFNVEVEHQAVEVLGTHFNINSYKNEAAIKTTLLEGKVRVYLENNSVSQVLSPGQEASLNHNGKLSIKEADTLEAISWKNGEFIFNDASLANIMRQIERWYDVDVDYLNIPDTHYNGTISQNVKLSQVLQMLEITSSVKFKIEGKSIKIKYKPK